MKLKVLGCSLQMPLKSSTGQATAAALYAGLANAGVQTPFCNWGLFAEGLVAKCQGVFVVNPK
ncbi:MAG: hypothetical protein CM15mP98_04690 [Paracoccaceae bacterium]|nr:MAG: hypothetical protein CM15mP98_04690 [Paracoccaceae bacterium]